MRILLNEGADPSDVIAHAADLEYQKALLFLFDVGHLKAVSACSILERLIHLSHVSTETLSVLVHSRAQAIDALAVGTCASPENRTLTA